MAYTINLTNGTVLTTVNDGTINADSTSLKLVGKNYTGYGEFLNENFVWLLENFARDNPPPTPIEGQCWWDSNAGVLNVYDGTKFKAISSSTVDSVEPTTGVEGDLWWNTTDQQLYVFNGTSWVLIGPSYTSTTGRSGTVVEIIQDQASQDHVIVSTYVEDVRVSIHSWDPEFIPMVAPTGYTTIRPGINLIGDAIVPGVRFIGIATDTDKLGGYTENQFLRSDVDTSTNSLLNIFDDRGLIIGADSDLILKIVGDDALIYNSTLGGKLQLGATDTGGVYHIALTFDPDSNPDAINFDGNILSSIGDPVSAQDAVTLSYLTTTIGGDGSGLLKADGTVTVKGNLLPNTNGTRNLGSGAATYNEVHANTFYGTATEALYADIAERFEADDNYVAGTVVALGGMKEITEVEEDLSDTVFGVISTKPAHLMNAAAGTNATHPPIAMSGRVPVRVIGEVRKGDRLVSAGKGLARTGSKEEITPFNVIGRSLEDKYTEGQGVIEATVSMNT